MIEALVIFGWLVAAVGCGYLWGLTADDRELLATNPRTTPPPFKGTERTRQERLDAQLESKLVPFRHRR